MRTSDRPWTDTDVKTLIRRRHAGDSFAVIAEALGRTENAVRCYADLQVGLLSGKEYQRLKRALRPDSTNGQRPGIVDFMHAGWTGADNRGWGRFLDDAKGGQE